MNKKDYEVCCYTCQHNGQETCQGCITFLNGENEPYGDWRLREDLEAKDQQIVILEKALELACERLKYFEEMQDNEMGFTEMFGYTSQYDLQEIIDSYMKQAKEMGKNEWTSK